MQQLFKRMSRIPRGSSSRRGSIAVIAAAIMVVVMAFAAFTVDVGYITLTKSQLQNAADGATLAAGQELAGGLGADPILSNSLVVANARAVAVDMASRNKAGDKDSVYANPINDVRFGQYEFDASTQSWQENWGATPYNMVEVTLRRGTALDGDGPLPLFFAPVIGHATANLQVSATIALQAGSGFRIPGGTNKTADILPIAFDEPSWDALIGGVGNDSFQFDPATGQVTSGSDGVLEVNIYPEAAGGQNNNGNGGNGNGNGNGNGGNNNNGNNNSWTPGNRGTIDIGPSNNSTADLKRQIEFGVNENDLSYFGGEITFDQGPVDVNGDTGISAGIEAALQAIVGQTRALPIFTTVTGNGNNTTYTLVKFVAVTILEAELGGNNKRVIVQPSVLIDSTVVPSTDGSISVDNATIFTTPKLIR